MSWMKGMLVRVTLLGCAAAVSARAASGVLEAEESADPRQVQAALDAGIRWLAAKQIKEGPDAGRWPCPQYPTTVASLSGLALLANGCLPGEGEYGRVVDRAMKTVQGSMTPDGYLGAAGDSMYVHAICTLFGLSYLGMSSDARTEKDLAEVCRRAIAVIVEAQKIRKEAVEQGGWRYGPASLESDVSVTSWQLLTLHAARQCGYEVDARVFEDGLRYVNGAFVEGAGDKAGFVYRPGVSQLPEPGITGTALFIKSLLEKEKDERFREGYAYLRESRPGWGGEQYKGYFYFVTFYVAQGVFQEGDEAWAEFAPQVRRLLLDHQLNDGSWEFPPDTKEGPLVGDAYSTAMAVLLLSMDKQYLPMYQRRAGLYK